MNINQCRRSPGFKTSARQSTKQEIVAQEGLKNECKRRYLLSAIEVGCFLSTVIIEAIRIAVEPIEVLQLTKAYLQPTTTVF